MATMVGFGIFGTSEFLYLFILQIWPFIFRFLRAVSVEIDFFRESTRQTEHYDIELSKKN